MQRTHFTWSTFPRVVADGLTVALTAFVAPMAPEEDVVSKLWLCPSSWSTNFSQEEDVGQYRLCLGMKALLDFGPVGPVARFFHFGRTSASGLRRRSGRASSRHCGPAGLRMLGVSCPTCLQCALICDLPFAEHLPGRVPCAPYVLCPLQLTHAPPTGKDPANRVSEEIS